MTNKNLTSIVLVIDRSGSMESIAATVEEALEEFLNGQKREPGDLTIDTVFFDDRYEERAVMVDPKKNEIDLSINPRGMTALYDAVGKKINSFGEKLASLSEDARPDKILFVIATDGHENSSREFKSKTIAKMIKHQQDKYGWDFTFIGANQDAVLTAQEFNIPAEKAITFAANEVGTRSVIGSMDRYAKSFRAGAAAAYDESDRDGAMKS